MILIYPPVAKICEPPGGVAYLAGALKHYGIKCIVIDANLEALLWLGRGRHGEDRWTKRAVKHFDRNIADLKNRELYKNPQRYRQRVFDINRAISSALPGRFRISLADYHDSELLPVRSCDLIDSFENFIENPFYNYFEDYLGRAIEESIERKNAEILSCDINSPMEDYIGISLSYLSQALTGFALAGWVKARFPGIKIIMGGGLVTSWMSFPDWKNPFKSIIDIMIKGHGEPALLKIAGQEIKPMDRFVPDFDFARWDSYLAPGRILPYRASSGCYWNKCRFCPERAEKSHYKPEKNSEVIKDLEILSRRYHSNTIHFLDNGISPSLLTALSKKKMPFIWYGFARFMKKLADPEFANRLYDSGCRMLKLGLESGDQDVLDYMHKGTDLVLVSNVLKALKSAGIATYIYILFGTLRETEILAYRTLSYIASHSDEINFINTAIFNLPRFGDDADSIETERFYEGDLSLYLNFIHPKGWNRKDIRRFISKKLKKHPLIGPSIRNIPPFFTSNHAVFISP